MNMKLFLIHSGFYDKKVSAGFYESHTNYFVVAVDAKEAKAKAKELLEFQDKKMHIDGIMELDKVDGYKIILQSSGNGDETLEKQYSYDDVKEMT